jgi:hypothetical protein
MVAITRTSAIEARTSVVAVMTIVVRPPPAASPCVTHVANLINVRDLVGLGDAVWHCRCGAGRESDSGESSEAEKCEFKFHLSSPRGVSLDVECGSSSMNNR